MPLPPGSGSLFFTSQGGVQGTSWFIFGGGSVFIPQTDFLPFVNGGGGSGGGSNGGSGGSPGGCAACGALGGMPSNAPGVLALNSRPPFPSAGGFKIAENESPRPQDRIFFNNNFFDNINNTNTDIASVQRQTIGFEKTFLDGDASVGVRVPFFDPGFAIAFDPTTGRAYAYDPEPWTRVEQNPGESEQQFAQRKMGVFLAATQQGIFGSPVGAPAGKTPASPPGTGLVIGQFRESGPSGTGDEFVEVEIFSPATGGVGADPNGFRFQGFNTPVNGNTFQVFIPDSIISGNLPGQSGGGIFAGGSVTIPGSTVSGNQAQSGKIPPTPPGPAGDRPLLLQPGDALDPRVADEIARLGGTATILGGQDAVAPPSDAPQSGKIAPTSPGGGIAIQGGPSITGSTVAGNTQSAGTSEGEPSMLQQRAANVVRLLNSPDPAVRQETRENVTRFGSQELRNEIVNQMRVLNVVVQQGMADAGSSSTPGLNFTSGR